MEIHIDGFIGDSGFFGGDSFTLKQLNENLANLKPNEHVNLIINSGGGYVTEGFAIYDKLMSIPNVVNTTVLGLAGSIATVIAQAGKKGKRKMYQNSDYFIHNPSWTPQSPDPLEAADLANLAEDLQKAEEKILNFYNSITGTSLDILKEKMNAAQMLSSDEAVQLGFIDEIINTNTQATRVYKIAAHISKPINITMTIENKLKEMFNAFKAEMTAIVAPAAEPTATVEPTEPVTKTELEIANEKLAELEAKLAEYETAKAAEIATAVEAKATEVTTAVTAELTAKYDAKFTAFESKFFTGDKLNAEIVQMVKGDAAPELTAAEKLIAYRKSLSTK